MFFHESFFRELAEKSNHGLEKNEYSSHVHLIQNIIWMNGNVGAGETKYGYTTDQILGSVDESEYSKSLSSKVVSVDDTELGTVSVSNDTKLSNLIHAARKFYSFNKKAEEVIIVTSEEDEEDIKDNAGEDCEITVKNPTAALDYVHDTNIPINR